jgi:hypothetical protein
MNKQTTIEEQRLAKQKEDKLPTASWGPYLSERQWGTVREDYSKDGNAWGFFPHEHARSKAYRWGEDGLAGISDAQSQLCFAPGFWNGKDPILKERLFGLANGEGNHGEDVKELYYYLDNTPSHSFMQYLYKYPQGAFPYEQLLQENKKRSLLEEEFELLDTGIFEEGNYFDITITYAKIDLEFAKRQQILINREWYTRPNGQIPAYEWSFSDVNPPVQAWAAMRVYEIDKKKTGIGDIDFLKRIFQKLTINFTWWSNQKDAEKNYVFEGGFLGLDNIGVLDRNSIIEKGCILEQADGTAWMGMFATYMLEMALEIALNDDSYQDVALKYFEPYTLIAESLNTNGLWDEEQNFFYDVLKYPGGKQVPLKVRSIIGLTSIFAALFLPLEGLNKLEQFKHGFEWFRKFCEERELYEAVIQKEGNTGSDKLISLIKIEKLQKLLTVLLDEDEFLSPYGIRSLSKKHTQSYDIEIDNEWFSMQYEPGESTTKLFGSNSNWHGPVWFPMNYLIIRSLKAYYQYFRNDMKVEFPSRSGNLMNLKEVAIQLNARLQKIFTTDKNGNRPVFGRFKDF